MAVVWTGSHVVHEERARAWTEAPSSLSALWRQRYRWCYGTLQAVWKHRDAVRLVVVQPVVAALAGVRPRWHVLQRTGEVVVRS